MMHRLESVIALGFLGIATLLACAESSPRGQETSPERIKEMIAAEIGPGIAWVDNTVRLSPETSAAVPGLLYYWGRRDPTSDHGSRPQAIVATRSRTARVLRIPSDWAVVAEGWSPATADAAIAACTELVATVRPRYTDPPVLVGPHTGSNARDSIIAVVYADTLRRFADSLVLSQGLSLTTFLSDSAATLLRANRTRLAPPQASSPAASSWAVALWGLHDHGAFRYGCTFPRPRWWNRAGARMTVTDSIRWPPFPP